MKKLTWSTLLGRPEAAMAVVLIGIVAALVMPLSRTVLDILTVLSMASCLFVLLVAVRVQSPVQLLTFPALLLITTMLRLSLNVASTKMILLDGEAAHVVEAFGRVVMGDNLLVGLCVFAIVSVVQFLVVAKGADRVAEVAARFSLDAMPGKQMSIDGEMRAGTLSAEQASQRRDKLDIESRFFGGMDGAMKFVKGDAIAGLVITFINIFGGLASGMLYQDMSASVALHRYATLSVGDAMVAQIPSFMIAIAAGLVTTRVTSNQGAQSDLGRQILLEVRRHPSAMVHVGLFCVLLGLVPGFPAPVFVALGLMLLGTGVWVMRLDHQPEKPVARFQQPMKGFCSAAGEDAPVFIEEQGRLFDAAVVLALPRHLAEQADLARLDQQMLDMRQRLSQIWGAPYPGLRCCLDTHPAMTGWLRGDAEQPRLRWIINGSHLMQFAWRDDAALVLGPPSPHDDGPLQIPGFPDARWEPPGTADVATLEQLICAVTEHLCVREQSRLLSHEQFHAVLLEFKASHPHLAEGLAAVVPLPVLTDVVRTLLREGIGLRSLPQVCDMMLSFAPLPQDANAIADMIVTGWSRRRCAEAAIDGRLQLHLVDPLIEQVLQAYAASASEAGASQAPDPDAFREVRQCFAELQARVPRGRINLVCRGPARLLVSEIAGMVGSRFRVFSFRGVNPRYDVEIVSRIELSEAALQRMGAQNRLLDPEQWDTPGDIDPARFDDPMNDDAFGDAPLTPPAAARRHQAAR